MGTCSLKCDGMEFFRYIDDIPDDIPWLKKAVRDGVLDSYRYGDWIFNNENGQYMLVTGDVIVRNRLGDLKFFTANEFASSFNEVI